MCKIGAKELAFQQPSTGQHTWFWRPNNPLRLLEPVALELNPESKPQASTERRPELCSRICQKNNISMSLSFAPQERTLEWERTRVSGPPQDKKTVIFRSQCAGCAFADIILLFSVHLWTSCGCARLLRIYVYK